MMNNQRSYIFIMVIIVALTSSFNVQKYENYSLTILVENLRNSQGFVQFAIYNQNGSIPDENYNQYYRISKAKITNKSSLVTFENIPAGNYAVNILHDENSNGKIDKGLILPKEGIGFSNFESIGFSNRPNFDKASFNLKNNTKIKVKIIYM